MENVDGTCRLDTGFGDVISLGCDIQPEYFWQYHTAATLRD
ncbi:hypothetical protein [Serratia fonticola]|nr:hypothetical protein [Serratia fonticola]